LRYGHPGDRLWIWPFQAEQQILLDPAGCTIALALANSGSEAMPAGLGLHPYVRRRPETRVRFEAQSVMLSDRATMPTGIEAPADHFGDFAAGDALPGETIDHCYRNWAGTVTIADDLGTIRVSATGAPHLHVYAPADGSALCCEPVSHTPDALNRAPDEMIALEPGQTARLTLRIEAS
jgi:aldose 1-epimerase